MKRMKEIAFLIALTILAILINVIPICIKYLIAISGLPDWFKYVLLK